MAAHGDNQDKHFPLFAHANVLRSLFGKPQKFCAFAEPNQTVADLGSGPGFYTLPLAAHVGPLGRVYAVDSDERAVRAVERKAAKRGLTNIRGHAASASNLDFIVDDSVDFVLANGLLCSVAPTDHQTTLREIQRILKPGGKAYFAVAKGSMSYVDEAEWKQILSKFSVLQRGDGSLLDDRWALVSSP
jgi:ubiquinone/menaquinone biosynthesis C-methylase UbiE